MPNPSRRVSVRPAAVPWIAPRSVCRASRANGLSPPSTCSRASTPAHLQLPADGLRVEASGLDVVFRPRGFSPPRRLAPPCAVPGPRRRLAAPSGFPFPSRGVAGLLHPAANPGVRLRFALTKTAVSGGLCVEFPAARFAPLEGVPFPTAASRRRDPCPLAVFTTSRRCSVVKSVIRRSHCCALGCSPSWASIPSEVPSGS